MATTATSTTTTNTTTVGLGPDRVASGNSTAGAPGAEISVTPRELTADEKAIIAKAEVLNDIVGLARVGAYSSSSVVGGEGSTTSVENRISRDNQMREHEKALNAALDANFQFGGKLPSAAMAIKADNESAARSTVPFSMPAFNMQAMLLQQGLRA